MDFFNPTKRREFATIICLGKSTATAVGKKKADKDTARRKRTLFARHVSADNMAHAAVIVISREISRVSAKQTEGQLWYPIIRDRPRYSYLIIAGVNN